MTTTMGDELANEVEAVKRAGIPITDRARVHKAAERSGLEQLAVNTTTSQGHKKLLKYQRPVEEKQYQEWAEKKAKQLEIAQAILHENK